MRITTVWAWSDVEQDAYGDELLTHYASYADDDGEPIGDLYKFWDADDAFTFAQHLQTSHPTDLELITEELIF
ncbi:MAG: hypothetical protein OCU12_07850 [Methanophagales archaeon]|nr:hypothetical protein [Methanophagales archaeon]